MSARPEPERSVVKPAWPSTRSAVEAGTPATFGEAQHAIVLRVGDPEIAGAVDRDPSLVVADLGSGPRRDSTIGYPSED